MSYIQISEADRCSVDHGVHLDIYWMLFVMCVHLHLNVYVWSVLSASEHYHFVLLFSGGHSSSSAP